MKTNTITAKVKQIIKKGYSFYGNPHYMLILETDIFYLMVFQTLV